MATEAWYYSMYGCNATGGEVEEEIGPHQLA
jgi:hypothetical protein